MTNLCQELEPLLAERAAGDIAPDDAARLDAHLEACERCRQELAAYRETLHLVRLPPDPGRPPALDVATFANFQRGRRRRVTGLTIGAGFGAAVVAASVVLAPALLTLRSLPAQKSGATDPGASVTYASAAGTSTSSDEVTPEDAVLAAFDEADSATP